MSKTNFDPRAKAFIIGEDQAEPPKETREEGPSVGKSTYESRGASKWKAVIAADDPLVDPTSSPLSDMSDIASVLGNSLGRAKDLGILGGADPMRFKPASKWDMQIWTPRKNECYNYFEPVELPPSFSETKALFPDEFDKINMKSSIDQARTYYEENLMLLNERKASIENILSGGGAGFDGFDAAVARQFISKLEKGIIYTQRQMDELSEYEKEQGIGTI